VAKWIQFETLQPVPGVPIDRQPIASDSRSPRHGGPLRARKVPPAGGSRHVAELL